MSTPESSHVEGSPADSHEGSEALAAELLESSSEHSVNAGVEAESWQGIEHFRDKLHQLQQRIIKLEEDAEKLDEQIGDLQGTSQDAKLQRLEEEQAALLLEASNLRLERIALVESVPSEHYAEANRVRTELGLTIKDASSQQ